MGRMKGAVAEVYEELKEKGKEEVGLNITVTKTKAMVQNRRRRISEILTNEDHDIEVVRGFKYVGTVINNTNDETEEIQAANKAYSSLQTIFRSQVHCNNKMELYKTLIKPALCYGSVTWTQTRMTEQILCTFERKTSRRIYGPIQDKGRWLPRWNSTIYNLYKDLNIVCNIQIRRLRWAGHIIRMKDEQIPVKVLNGKFCNTRPVGIPGTRWEDVQRDTSQILGIRGWRR
jgi:hypothetical protein